MASLDMSGSQPAGAVERQAAQLERLGPWLMAGYWLALLAVFALGAIASGV